MTDNFAKLLLMDVPEGTTFLRALSDEELRALGRIAAVYLKEPPAKNSPGDLLIDETLRRFGNGLGGGK